MAIVIQYSLRFQRLPDARFESNRCIDCTIVFVTNEADRKQFGNYIITLGDQNKSISCNGIKIIKLKKSTITEHHSGDNSFQKTLNKIL